MAEAKGRNKKFIFTTKIKWLKGKTGELSSKTYCLISNSIRSKVMVNPKIVVKERM